MVFGLSTSDGLLFFPPEDARPLLEALPLEELEEDGLEVCSPEDLVFADGFSSSAESTLRGSDLSPEPPMAPFSVRELPALELFMIASHH